MGGVTIRVCQIGTAPQDRLHALQLAMFNEARIANFLWAASGRCRSRPRACCLLTCRDRGLHGLRSLISKTSELACLPQRVQVIVWYILLGPKHLLRIYYNGTWTLCLPRDQGRHAPFEELQDCNEADESDAFIHLPRGSTYPTKRISGTTCSPTNISRISGALSAKYRGKKNQ